MTEKIIKRDILIRIEKYLEHKEILLIIGPRQTGKTTLMMATKQKLDRANKKSIFLSLDFESDKKHFESQASFLQKLRLEFGEDRGFVFIDEIQRKEDAGLFLKGLYDMDLPYKFIVSGSGSVELKEKTHESLAGRKIVFEMQPVSFFEFVNFKTDYRYENRLDEYFAIESKQGMLFLEEYLNFGGYPRVILEERGEEKRRVISEIYRSYLEKDIFYLLRLEKTDAFDALVKILASQTGNILNYSKIAGTIGISVATVKKYIWFLEKTFVAKQITPFFKNIKKEISKAPSVYFYDLGLRNYALGIFGQITRPEDFGFLFQNFIFNILEEKLGQFGGRVRFWRTKDRAEVDFVLSLGEKNMPVEIKYKDFKNEEVERSLKSFVDKYSPNLAMVINKNFTGEVVVGKTNVIFLPYWKTAKLAEDFCH